MMALGFCVQRPGPGQPLCTRQGLRTFAAKEPQWNFGASCRWSLAAAGATCAVLLGVRRRLQPPRKGPGFGGSRPFPRAAEESTTMVTTQSTKIWPSIVRFVLPTYTLVVTNMVLTALDKSFVGRTSSLQLAALGPASAAFDCSSYLLTFLNTATLFLLGSLPAEDLNRTRSHALIFAVASGTIQAVILLCTAVSAVKLLGAAGAMLPFSVLYLRLRAFGAPIDRLGSISTQFWLAQKDGVTPLLATLISAGFNALGDFLLCPKYGVGGAAWATVAASTVSAAYLVAKLVHRGLWPRPWVLPTMSDLKPFAAFAGPVFLVLLMKVVLFSIMTMGATMLGTGPAAAHQVLVSIFFVSGIAFGQPLSWAVQTFLPTADGSEEFRKTCRALLTVAALFVALSGVTAGAMSNYCLGWFSKDPLVLKEALAAAPAVVGFVVLYASYLTLEGFAIAQKRLTMCLIVSTVLSTIGGGTIMWLQASGLLSLRSLWGSQSLLLLGATAAVGLSTLAGNMAK